MNFSRAAFLEKRGHIFLRHVRSHQGGITDDDKGKEAADALAKEYRRQAATKAIPYFMKAEEFFILQHDGNNIQGDPRTYLKSLEQKVMLKILKEKSEKQSEWLKQFPRQIFLHAERVWKWSIQAGDGKAWLYFIFAACQWLPTNHRLFYKDKSEYRRDKCPLCLSSDVEDMAHVLMCPALRDVQRDLRSSVQNKFEEWKIPLAKRKIVPVEEKRKDIWFCRTRAIIAAQTGPGITQAISSESLAFIIEDYCRTNQLKQFISYKKFLSNLRSLLRRFVCSCAEEHTCKLRKCAVVNKDLVKILTHHFKLSMEYGTDPLHRSHSFPEWSSSEPEDATFGATLIEGKTPKANFFKQDLSGKNVFMIFDRIWDEKQSTNKLFWEDLERQISTKEPTRILVVAPSQYVDLFLDKKHRGVLELARVKNFSFEKPDSFRTPSTIAFIPSLDISIVLVLNKESMFRDPFDWSVFKGDLLKWSEGLDLPISTPHLTNSLFLERLQPGHRARRQVIPNEINSNIYHFFDPHAPVVNEETHLKVCGIDAQNAHLINKINQQNRCLSVLGILPSHLRILARNSVKEHEEALSDISKTLFWKGYAIWTKRKALIADYWKNIARDEWKVHKSKKQISEHKKTNKSLKAIYQCANPFHFLVKHRDLSHNMPTPCPCSRNCLSQADMGSRNIQNFFRVYQLQSPDPLYDNSGKHMLPSNMHHVTREDIIRREHDRGKKRKK